MQYSLDEPRTLGPSHDQLDALPFQREYATRPSLLDPQLPCEPGLSQCVCLPNVVVLYVDNRPVATIKATRLDQASLDSWLARLRSRWPRTAIEV